MNNFKKLIKEALTPNFLNESGRGRQGTEEYREMSFEVWYSPEDGYNIKGREEIINPFAFFEKALQLPHIPAPEVTTENGRRLFFIQSNL